MNPGSVIPIIVELINDPIKNIALTVKRHICYPFNCNSNVEKLRAEAEELKNKRVRLQKSIEEATRKGEEVHEDVKNWQINADKAIEEVQQLIAGKEEAMKKRCFIGLGPDLKMRWQLSREADKKASAIRNGKELPENPISYRPAPKQITAPSVYSREALQSRVSMLNDVMDALKDPKVNMVGVYGMGGVGKTTLAKEVHREAQNDESFGVVVMVAVSPSPEIASIQKEIAAVLGLDLDEEGVLLRANKLCERLKKEKKKTLIILDDVWIQLKLEEEVGIPTGDDCKILLTSRRPDVCLAVGAKKSFGVEVLSDEEAWNLFKMTVADDAEDRKLPSIATQVCKKCSGLPLLLVLVATELRNKEQLLYAWEDKLRQLSEFDSEEMYEKVHKVLESSYNNLHDNEVKSFFLLCGLFGQSNIRIQYLVEYSMGLGLFKRINTVEDARNRVYRLIDDLRAECLLLDGDMDGFVKMQDLVRDISLSIASREQDAFVGISGFEVTEWPSKDCTRISLPYCDVQMLPAGLECPKAEILLLFTEDFSLQIPDSFFEGIRKLKVVDLSRMRFVSLPSSLGMLSNIQTLCLRRCQLNAETAIIGNLKQLQILSFADSDIVELPREIEQLSRLKLLDLSDCSELRVIPANVFSKLTNLEELYMLNSFDQWGHEDNSNNNNVRLAELEYFSHLSTLEIQVPDPAVLPKLLLFSSRGLLRRYKISFGKVRGSWSTIDHKTSKALYLRMSQTSIRLEQDIKALLKEAEEVRLNDVMGIENVLYDLDLDGEGFPQLKHLDVRSDLVDFRNDWVVRIDSGSIQHIIDSCSTDQYQCAAAFPNLESLCIYDLRSLKNVCNGSVAAGSFSRLTKLSVTSCRSITNLFPLSTARFLSQLEVLEVSKCSNIEHIVVTGTEIEQANGGEIMLEFTQLRSLTLDDLPSLRSFCRQPTELDDAPLSLFNTKVSFPNLTILMVNGCHKLKHLFLVSWVLKFPLQQLRKLLVRDCHSMEDMISIEKYMENNNHKKILFPKLDSLMLYNLPKLKRFCGEYSIEFQSLRELKIWACRELMNMVPSSVNATFDSETSTSNQSHSLFNHMVAFRNLEVLDILDMEGLKCIWHNQFADDDSFSKLKSLNIESCPKLSTIFSSSVLSRFQRLEKLRIRDCDSVQEIYQVPQQLQLNDAMVYELEDLYIYHLDSLKHIWSKDPQGVFTFPNLQSVRIFDSGSLKNIFPVSIARDLLHLEYLEIVSCWGVEEIIAKAEEVGEDEPILHFKFPKLFSIKLKYLEELTSFYPEIHVSSWPKLKYVEVYDCHKQIDLTPKAHGESQLSISNRQPAFFVEKGHSLEEMRLDGAELMMMAESGRFPIERERFPKLKVVEFTSLDYSKGIIRFVQRLRNLDKLIVRFGGVQVLFSHEEELVGEDQLVHVKHLELYSLDHLEHIWMQHSRLKPLLKALKVKDCHSLIKIVPSSSCSFENLLTLHVSLCDGLINLLTTSTAKTMVQLTKLKVKSCNNMTEIVAKDGDEGDVPADKNENEIVIFKKLKFLKLQDLRSLTSFCSGDEAFSFPSLEQAEVDDCYQMKMFCWGPLSTPKLQGLSGLMKSSGLKWEWEGTLNETIGSQVDKWEVNKYPSSSKAIPATYSSAAKG